MGSNTLWGAPRRPGDQLPYSMGGPWVDKDAPVGSGAREYDDLDRELTDEEIEAAMGWEQTAGDDETDGGAK